ncbi:MAG: CRISPR system precrRNA processing endoribonuclease RAMP protein Cas6 [Thermodesulfobacteriota bacterium]|nr:CRISPR system precrRNA processing endoribonuclease RAMP protein Cas6 [Thermodesulfobacteriota bacterium]
MLYGTYLFSSVFETDAILPVYKGSTFRGVFGHALKKVVCALKRRDCKDCLLKDKCVYSFVFETPGKPDRPEGKKRIAAPPHPYVIEPPDTNKTHYKKGENFDFALILFGRANEYLPYFIYAFECMGDLGIGKGVDGKRARFILKNVITDNITVYSGETRKINTGKACQELLILHNNKEKFPPVSAIELTFKTPLRNKFQNRLEASLPFHILMRAVLRRISSLYNYHGNGEPPLDYRGLVERAKYIEIKSSALRWFDWKRYSNKQDRSMLMGGMVGKVTYLGDLTEFLPLVRFCEKTHLGKQTSFGLGKIEITGIWE